MMPNGPFGLSPAVVTIILLGSYGLLGFLLARMRKAKTSSACWKLAIAFAVGCVAFSFFKAFIAIVYLFGAISQVHMAKNALSSSVSNAPWTEHEVAPLKPSCLS